VSVVVDASAGLDIGLGLQPRLALLLEGEDLHVPMTFDVDVASALRRLELAGTISAGQAVEVRVNLGTVAMDRYPPGPLIDGCWPWRHTITVQDGIYVVLARQLGARLLTTDDRLARAAVDLVPLLR
jgi:predicted nucleic acid-binding protein